MIIGEATIPSIEEMFTIDPPPLAKKDMFLHPKDGDFDAISYKLAYKPPDRSPENLLVDTSSGKILFSVGELVGVPGLVFVRETILSVASLLVVRIG